MDPLTREKLDPGTLIALGAYRTRAAAAPDAAISVTLSFEGELGPIGALGFETNAVAEDQALGVIRLRENARRRAPQRYLDIGRCRAEFCLDPAVSDGRVRASVATMVGAGSDGPRQPRHA